MTNLKDYRGAGRIVAARDPFGGAPVGYLLGADLLPSRSALASMAVGRRADTIIARLDGADATLAPPELWSVDSVWIAHEPVVRNDRPTVGITVEEIPTAIETAVLVMLAKAGVAGAREHVNLDDAIRRVRAMADDGALANARSIVARSGTSIVAHATFRCDAADVVTHELFTELVDTYVIEEWAGRGLGTFLTDQVLAAAHRHSQRVLGHVIWDDGRGARVLAALTQDAWVRVFTLYRTDVGNDA